MEGNLIKIVTNDNKEFVVSLELNKMCHSLMEIETYPGCVVNLDADSVNFGRIVEFCQHHSFINPPELVRPLMSNELERNVHDPWDALFINAMSLDDVTDLLVVANKLKCTSLADLCYAKIALYIRTTPLESLKKDFYVPESDFTEKDVDQIKEANEWLMTLTEDRIKELDN